MKPCLLLPLAFLALVACHESPQAVTAQVVDLTNAVCALAPDSPVDAPIVEVVCSLVQAGEGAVSVIVGQTADAGLAASASVQADHVLYRFPLPKDVAPAFLAAHKGK